MSWRFVNKKKNFAFYAYKQKRENERKKEIRPGFSKPLCI